MATPECLAIVDDEIRLNLNPTVLEQIELDIIDLSTLNEPEEEVTYKINSLELLQVLASSVGLASLRQGAIVIWTYYSDKSIAHENDIPILRTVINIDGDLSQKVCQDILEHPLGDRIFKANSFIVGQIFRQLITVIEDYVETKLRPFTIATISMVTVFAWCEPLQKIGVKLNITDAVVGNCWRTVIAAPTTVIAIWWINSKLPFQWPSLPKLGRNFKWNSWKRFGKALLRFLESPILRVVAIAVIVILIVGWLLNTLGHFPVDSRIQRFIRVLEPDIEPYLPIAIISLRKIFLGILGKIFLRYSFFVKLIFGRFVR